MIIEAEVAVDGSRTRQDEPRALVTFSVKCTGMFLMFGELSGVFL